MIALKKKKKNVYQALHIYENLNDLEPFLRS